MYLRPHSSLPLSLSLPNITTTIFLPRGNVLPLFNLLAFYFSPFSTSCTAATFLQMKLTLLLTATSYSHPFFLQHTFFSLSVPLSLSLSLLSLPLSFSLSLPLFPLFPSSSFHSSPSPGDRIAILSQGSLICAGSFEFLRHNYGRGHRLSLVTHPHSTLPKPSSSSSNMREGEEGTDGYSDPFDNTLLISRLIQVSHPISAAVLD